MSEKIFLDELEKIGIKLGTKQINQFATYFQLLIEWNEKINLTSIVEFEVSCSIFLILSQISLFSLSNFFDI